MMSCCSEEEFYDTKDEISSLSDFGGDNFSECVESSFGNSGHVFGTFGYDLWVKKPESVDERRTRFLKWMAMDNDDRSSGGDGFVEINRIVENSGAALGNIDLELEERVWSSRCSSTSCISDFARNFSGDNDSLDEIFKYRIKNLDDGTEFIIDECGEDGMLNRLREVGSNRLVTFEEFERLLGLSPMFQQLVGGNGGLVTKSEELLRKRIRKGWLKKLGVAACVVDRQRNDDDYTIEARARRVWAHTRRKHAKEFSAIYMGQDIRAHKGSILTMKFSPDGQYLASAGEDGIVRVWQVVDRDISNETKSDVIDIDPSYTYFTVNSSSEVSPLITEKDKMGKIKKMRNASDSTCVILPPKVFRLSEKPLHEFHGHNGEVLDLSWSKNKYLLSSSVDKTVRLWQVGCNECVNVFSHNNYVTCVEFNPVDDNYFISGSIDGKVRIWIVPGCQVIDWIDIKEIVTAVCYRPDGQGGIVGSMTGNCYFYDAPDSLLQLGAQVCLHGKKKSPGKRIIGFQFSNDSSKVMVTSADSQVRILDGVDIICKYRGLKNAGSQISASFTSDGKHIVSASEDSNVYVWNYNSQNGPKSSHAKNIWSSEHFCSSNASVAIPWCGFSSGSSAGYYPSDQVLGTPIFGTPVLGAPLGNSPEIGWRFSLEDKSHNQRPMHSRDCFSLSHQLFSDILPKGTATWPEEKLPASNTLTVSAAIGKSQYKFLKTSCQSTLTAPHVWGLVIVTASLDGHIRTFQNYGLPVRT